jgi:hypothetical protein
MFRTPFGATSRREHAHAKYINSVTCDMQVCTKATNRNKPPAGPTMQGLS